MPSNHFLPTDLTGAQTTIDYPHHEIHHGNHYTAHVYEADVDATSTLSVLIVAPSAKFAHAVFAIESSEPGEYLFSEAPNATGGTAITPRNNNRSSSNAATAVLTSDPTITSTGTVLDDGHMGETGNPAQRIGGNFSSRQEWILNKDEKYLIRFTSGAADASVKIVCEWYEESNG